MSEATQSVDDADQEHLATALEEQDEELAAALETIATMQATGTLDDIAAVADTLSLAQAALDDEMVMRLSATGSRLGEVADTAAEEEVAAGLEDALSALGEASAADPEPVGVVGLLKAMRDPEVRVGLGVAIAMLRALGQSAGADR